MVTCGGVLWGMWLFSGTTLVCGMSIGGALLLLLWRCVGVLLCASVAAPFVVCVVGRSGGISAMSGVSATSCNDGELQDMKQQQWVANKAMHDGIPKN